MTDPTQALTLPKRRDVKTLRTALEEVQDGDYVDALFHEKRYGTFRVTGRTVSTSGDKTLMLGGIPLDNGGNRKPSTNLHLLERIHPDSVDPDIAVLDDEYPFAEVVADEVIGFTSVRHGMALRVRFRGKPYGDFTVTGRAVSRLRPDGGTRRAMVGPWIVASRVDAASPIIEGALVGDPIGVVDTPGADLLAPVEKIDYENEES